MLDIHIKLIRDRLGLSPGEMALVLGCHRETVYRLESRPERMTVKRRMQLETLARLVEIVESPLQGRESSPDATS